MRETRTDVQVRLVLEKQAADMGRLLASALPAGVGFALILGEFGDGNTAYCSNVERGDVVAMLTELAARLNGGLDVSVNDVAPMLKIALEQLEKRKAMYASKRVDNARLPVGSPMTYFCAHCGVPIEMRPELHTSRPATICQPCSFLRDHGLI